MIVAVYVEINPHYLCVNAHCSTGQYMSRIMLNISAKVHSVNVFTSKSINLTQYNQVTGGEFT